MGHHKAMINWPERLKASGIHLGISLAIALLAALLVFLVWYPYPYREISGGRELFLLVVTVDVILGPLITLAIFNRRKPWRELRMDLAVVGLIQLGALGYGLWTVALARPVHLVFEVDRFRVIHAIDVPEELLPQKPADIEALPWTGPTLLGTREFKNAAESADATIAALSGVHLGSRPDLWQSYEATRSQVLKEARPVTQLRQRLQKDAPAIDAWLRATGRDAAATAFVPMVGRKSFWTVLVDPVDARVLGFVPLDSF